MYDTAVNLLNLMHLSSVSGRVTRAIAITAQSVLQTVSDAARRMEELKLLAHPDFATREIAKAQITTHRTPLGLDDDLAKIPRLAAEARLKSAKDYVGHDRRGVRGRGGRFRGRGRHHNNYNNNHNY